MGAFHTLLIQKSGSVQYREFRAHIVKHACSIHEVHLLCGLNLSKTWYKSALRLHQAYKGNRDLLKILLLHYRSAQMVT